MQNSVYFFENGAKYTPMIENNRSRLATIASASRHAIQTHVATTTHSTIAQTNQIHKHQSHSVHFSTHYTDYYIEKNFKKRFYIRKKKDYQMKKYNNSKLLKGISKRI